MLSQKLKNNEDDVVWSFAWLAAWVISQRPATVDCHDESGNLFSRLDISADISWPRLPKPSVMVNNPKISQVWLLENVRCFQTCAGQWFWMVSGSKLSTFQTCELLPKQPRADGMADSSLRGCFIRLWYLSALPLHPNEPPSLLDFNTHVYPPKRDQGTAAIGHIPEFWPRP